MGRMKTVVESLTITITDVDDELPTMLRLVDNVGDVVGNVIVAEGDVGVLGTLTAEDVDTMDGDLVYTIDDNVRFMVEEMGGDYVLKSKDTIDYEDLSDGTMVIQLTVDDGTNENSGGVVDDNSNRC